jgi:putative inorganic carbon (hco3(-)) transporter
MRNRSISSNPVTEFLEKVFLSDKLNHWMGLLVVVIIASTFAYLLSSNIFLGSTVLAAIMGICILVACFLSAELGLYVMTLYGFFASAVARFLSNDQLPVGVITDILVFTTFIGLFFSIKNLKENTTHFFRSRPVILYTIILVYLTFELFNPLGHSFLGWLQVMRKVFESFLVVFIAYNFFDSLSKVLRFIKGLFLFAFIVALYGCFQQWHGLLQFEIDWVNADPVRFGLICIWGEYRKFSLLGGPTEFGIVMAGCSLLFMLIGVYERNTFNKIMYIIGSIFMLLAMTYSGTRTANAMLAGGLLFFLLLTFNKKSSRIFAFVALLAFLFVLYAPIYSSSTLNRFRSTFSATQDASYNVREINRQTVQPFIWSHPFGSGLSTTGSMGEKYNPGNPNAGFPTDSSYLNKALESGWIGMALTCFFYFFLLQYTVRGYFATKTKKLKVLFAVCGAFFFSYFLGEMAQEAVGLFSNMMVFFPVLAIVLRLRKMVEKDSLSDVSSPLI